MKSTELLIKNLRDVYWKNRVNAAIELGEIGDPIAIFPLIEALKDEERVVSQSAVEALGKIGSPAIIPLIHILADENHWEIRSEVEDALIKIGKPAVRPLTRLLKNCNESFFISAANVLGQIGDPEAVLPLIDALEEGNLLIRGDAISALGKIRDKRAVSSIINDIKKHGASLESIKALGELRDLSTIPFLINMLRNKERWVAAESLGKMGKAAVMPLAVLLNNKEFNGQGVVAVALGHTGSKEAVTPLITAIRDKDPIASWRAARALVEIGEASVDPLIKMLNEENDYIRMLAVDSLSQISDKRVVQPLEKLVKNEDNGNIRHIALKVLDRPQTKNVSLPTCERKDIIKNVFVLELGLMERFFRAALADDILYLSWKDIASLKRGDLNPPIPVPYRYAGGRTVPEDFVWCDGGFIISDRIKELFTAHNFTGWKTYPINLYDKNGKLISGYHGFAVTAKVGPIDYSRSEIIAKPPIIIGKPNIVKKGLYFDENSWDGSDFLFAGYILVTRPVVEALRKAVPKVKNWRAIPASQYERSIIFDAVEPEFLTEKERDKINELRREFKIEHKQSLARTTETLVQREVNGKQLLILLKSIVQNQCMLTTISDQSFCAEILKSLRETETAKLINALENKDEEVRIGAAWALGRLRVKKAVDQLLKVLGDEDEQVRREAVLALGEIGDSRAVMPLIDILEGEDTSYVRCTAAKALGTLGGIKAKQSLISALKNEDEIFVLNEVAKVLGKFGDPSAAFYLIELFGNEDSNLAEHIREALVDIGQPVLIPLIQSIDNGLPLIRGRAAWTLGLMGEREAVLPLIDRLKIEEDPEILSFIVEALGLLGDKRAVKPILNIVQRIQTESVHDQADLAIQKILRK